MQDTASPPTKAGRGPVVWTLLVTSLATFMAALDNLVVTTALPVIRDDLGGGLADLEWIVNGYTLPFACLLLLGAALGDRFGRRRVFGWGVLLFTLASAAAAVAGSTGALIAARAAQGAGAAVLLPLSLTLISAAVPPERRGTAFGIWGAVNGLAVASGPLVGGAITEHISWQWIFWLNVPIGLALLPLVRYRLAESRGANDRLDLVGTALASAGLFGVVLSIVRGHEHGWTSGPVLAGFILGGLLLIAFVRWEMHTDHPMLPMRFFRSRTFAAVNAASLLMYAGMFGSIFLLTQFFQLIQGYSPLDAGLRMLPWTAMPMLVAPIAGALTDRIGGRSIVASGLALMAAGIAWLALLADPGVDYTSQIPAFILCGIGMAMFFAPTGAMVMGAVPPTEQGIASGVNNALREVGGALGIALLASVFAARGGYASPQAFTDGLVPALWVAVAALLAATAAVLFVPTRARPAAPAAPPAAPRDRAPEAAPAGR
ncbi:DHA2 family efflux MFS transporter permease subunit [Streptomyces johnsoniae]|uniref:DHA2 family efflux MFS transporter permease subunit n=1 Tax=Streptomyces johnsoniae TaxID=3075532 RepID=A0ABU2S3G1_9ACTN|nr:DHA2 family efflux MFS transporter permease subunit [Streptomyces sp. DSM 41886]MDT0443529.1 DHA2 family efflux MFS transporter permease subunit [Streptomyces sp. DSM 41886]